MADAEKMVELAPGIMFDTLGREARCKWAAKGEDGNSPSLQALQKALMESLEEYKKIGDVQRIICGDCLDFKVRVRIPFSTNDQVGTPEATMTEKMSKIDGATNVETQVYTCMTLQENDVEGKCDPISIVEGVEFTCIAREIRCKWSSKEVAAKCQTVLQDKLLSSDVVKDAMVQRIVCGECSDFKMVAAVPASTYGDFQKAFQAVEDSIIADLNAIDGVDNVETQTYTLMTL